MSRVLVALALFGVVALAAASGDAQKEWTGKSWLGKWQSLPTDKSENWEAFVNALAIPEQYTRDLQKTVHTFYKQGDHYHHIFAIPDKNFEKNIEFNLGAESSAKHGEHEVKIKYAEDGDKLVADVRIAAKNKHIHDVYEVQGEELVKTYKVGDVVAKRWFKKIAQ
ncbi:hypothetical protein BV898_16258 [Hypsibius exemplaris]|uniref:Uncharacterized protein n=1 Tax=Hypsibius exemplaris TaxID=2072580 RepID=A0A9X6NCX1_HYPEX|nr:hypothetical protein BV898_16258 [Hypsibius exemplaris]